MKKYTPRFNLLMGVVLGALLLVAAGGFSRPSVDANTLASITFVTPAGGDKLCLTWNTSGVPEGEYYIYGCLADGVNQVCRYSDVPVLVSH